MTFEIFSKGVGARRRWYFRGKGGNGEIIFPSESYTTRAKARKTVALIKREAATAEVVEL